LRGYLKGTGNEELDGFYADLFSTSHGLLTKGSDQDKEMYANLLQTDKIKFLALAIKTNEEKSAGKKQLVQIDFESQLPNDNKFEIKQTKKPEASQLHQDSKYKKKGANQELP
jgi:hypothetical protein